MGNQLPTIIASKFDTNNDPTTSNKSRKNGGRTHSIIDADLRTTLAKSFIGIVARDGHAGAKPSLQREDMLSPSIDPCARPSLPRTYHNGGSEPWLGELWPPVMANHTPPRPVLDRGKEPVNREVQTTNEPGMLDNALFRKDRFRKSTGNPIISFVATHIDPINGASDILFSCSISNGLAEGPKISAPSDTGLSQ